MFWKDTITLLLPFAESETHSPSEDQRPENSSSPKKSAAMFCSIRVKLLKSTDSLPSATDAPRAKSTECSLPDTAKAQPDDFQNKTGDNNTALNGLPDLNSSPRRASLPEAMEPNEQESSKIVSSPCTVATPPTEEEEEEGNVFRMFRSKNNNTLLDALCDSLIKEGVTKKFASKNFDENDDNSPQKKSGTIPCPKCDSTFSKLRYLKDHIKRKHDVYECPVCGDKSFNSHVGVEKHMRRAHNMHGEYLKKAMNAHREPVASLKEDSIDASQDDSDSCVVNGNVANGTPGHCNDDHSLVVTAANEQSSEDPDLCDDNSSVEMGKRKLKGTGTILCPHCPAMFSAQRNLKDHIKRKHLTFMCPICGEDNFVSQKGVERHMSRIHAEESPLPIGNACLDQLYLTNISHNSDSGSLADSSHEHSDASGYHDVPAELAWGNFSETSSRRKSKPFQIALSSVIPPFSQINTEFVHDSSEKWVGEPKKKKQRGMGTIPCPQCTSTFSEYRYLKDHLRRKHVRIECTVCGDTNFYSYKGLQRHMHTLHSQNDVSPLVQQSNKNILCNSKDVIQSVPIQQVNGNSQPDEAIIIPDDREGHQTLKPTSNLKGNEIPEDTQDENKIQGNRRLGRRKRSTTPVGRGKRKSEAQKSPDVQLEKESKGESIELNGSSEPKKKKRKRQSEVPDEVGAGDSAEEHHTSPNTKKKGSNKKAAEKKKPVVEVMEPQDESVADESDEEWQTVESKKQKKKKSRGNGTIPCPRCDSTFSKARYLRDHIKRKHDISVCPICGDKNFYSQRGVDRHIQTVHGGHVQK